MEVIPCCTWIAYRLERGKYCVTGHSPRQWPSYVKKCCECRKQNHFQSVCKSSWQKQQDWYSRKTNNEIIQQGNFFMEWLEEQDRSLNVVRVKYINLGSVKGVIFTKLESSTSQRQTHIIYKVESGVI